MNVHWVSIRDVRKARRNWKDGNYGERIKELKSPTTAKYKLLRVCYRVHPFTSISNEINKLEQKDELQDQIVDDLDEMERIVDQFQNHLDDWRSIKGEADG
jgi:hypothetical protein